MKRRFPLRGMGPELKTLSKALLCVLSVVGVAASLLDFITYVQQAVSNDSGQFTPLASPVIVFAGVACLAIAALALERAVDRERNRERGYFELARAAHLQTMRLVTLISNLRKNPDLATRAIDVSSSDVLPVESARFQFRIANLSIVDTKASELFVDPSRPQGVGGSDPVRESMESDVEFDFKFTLSKRLGNDCYHVTSWLYADRDCAPTQFRYYYRFRDESNEVSCLPIPYPNTTLAYPENEGFCTVRHDVDPHRVGKQRVFGMHYVKRRSFVWNNDETLAVYPAALVGSTVGRAQFRVELQKELYDLLKDEGGLDLTLIETFCSGNRHQSGYSPTHFERTMTVSVGTEDGSLCGKDGSDDVESPKLTKSDEASSLSSFCRTRTFVVFSTGEIEIHPDNVYMIICKTNEEGKRRLRHYSRMAKASAAVGNLVVREATVEDAERIHDLAKSVRDAMPHKDFFFISSVKRTAWKLRTNSYGYVVESGGSLIGYALFMVPGISSDENLGHFLGLSEEERARVMCFDSVAVDPRFRGRGILSELLSLGEEEAQRRDLDIFLATVDPRNSYCLRNMLNAGYSVVKYVMGMYHPGVPRVIVMKRLDGREMPLSDVSGSGVVG